MKDYRQYTKAYTFKEWETDKEWLARRLEFLWTFADYYPQLYCSRGLGDEKELIYSVYGSDNVIASMADGFHYGQYQDIYHLDANDAYEIFKEYDRLKLIKEHNIDFFLRKRIYIKYYYYESFIRDYLDEEYQNYSR